MGFLWNHWFWITLGVLVSVSGEASENSRKIIKNGEDPISLPLGARGGRALFLPQEQFSDAHNFDLVLGPTKRPTVSVSKSVSKVSVKMGKVSIGSEKSPKGLESLAKISDIYVDRGIRNRMPAPRRIQPYYIGYNLVYREPEKMPIKVSSAPSVVITHKPRRVLPPFVTSSPQSTSNPTGGLLATIIAKLKSLAEATSSRIRFSNLLTEPVLLTTKGTTTTTSTTAAPEVEGGVKQQHVLVRVDDLGVTTDQDQVEPQLKDEPVEQANEIGDQPGDLAPDVSVQLADQSVVPRDQPRSLHARGRSLPLPFLDQLEVDNKVEASLDWEEGEEGTILESEQLVLNKDTIQNIVDNIHAETEKQWEDVREILEEVEETEELSHNVVQEEESRSQELIQQADFIEDFTAPEYSFSGEDDVKISAERIDQSNISAVIGVILGIIIFIIISIVLVLLGVQRRHQKNAKAADVNSDVISQASYMTYSTTVSDHSVNYGPANWEKDMCEDLCSLDNDSFLNSLEAVTTTDYWGTDHY